MIKNLSNICYAYKSLPNVLFLSKSPQQIKLSTSKSLPSCLKLHYEQTSDKNKLSRTQQINKRKLHPTIGDLLGDDDLFHHYYRHKYSLSKHKRKRYHYHSYSSRNRSKYRYKKDQHQSSISSQIIESTSKMNEIYLYPPMYNYTSLSNYCYYCYSSMSSYCPYLISSSYNNIRI